MTLGLNVLVRIHWAKCCAKNFRLQDPSLREKSSCFPLTILRFGILDLGSVLEDDMLDTQFIVQSKYLILCSSYPSQCICITYRLLSTMWTIDEEDFTSWITHLNYLLCRQEGVHWLGYEEHKIKYFDCTIECLAYHLRERIPDPGSRISELSTDRKSTRLNSSHRR